MVFYGIEANISREIRYMLCDELLGEMYTKIILISSEMSYSIEKLWNNHIIL